MKKINTNSAKSIISALYKRLQDKGNWYLDPQCPDDDKYIDITEKAKENADNMLAEMSEIALYGRYNRWINDLGTPADSDGLVKMFLDETVYHLALSSLDEEEKELFQDSCDVRFYFIK